MKVRIPEKEGQVKTEVNFKCFDDILKYKSNRLQEAQNKKGFENWLGKLQSKNDSGWCSPNKLELLNK